MKIDASTRPQHRDLSVPGAYNTKATGRSEGAKNWAAAQAPAGRADDEYKRRMLESTVATLEQGGEAVNKLTLTISAQQQRRRQQQASAEADPSICGVSNDRTTPIEVNSMKDSFLCPSSRSQDMFHLQPVPRSRRTTSYIQQYIRISDGLCRENQRLALTLEILCAWLR